MFAVQFDRFGGPEVLSLGEHEEPHAGPGELRVRVRAAGVSPVDLSIRAGSSPSAKTLTLPHIPGVDVAGVVDEVGEGVAGIAIGAEVFGAVDVARLGGATAEFAILTFWAYKPESMPWDQAGAAGTSIETATRVLDLLSLGDGSTLLVDGASGGVGSILVQLAIARGARVIGTASTANHDFLRGLGVIPTTYGPGLVERLRGLGPIDFAAHVSGTGSLPELIELAGSPNAVVSIADFGAAQFGVRLSLGDLGGQRNGRHGLADAAELAAEGNLTIPLQRSFTYAEAAAAHRFAESGPRRGKVVLISD